VPGSPFTNSTITVDGLIPDTDYEWRVRTNCYGQSSNFSDQIPFTTLVSSCAVPTGLVTSNITQTSARFHWDPVPDAISYYVQWRHQGGLWHYLPGGPFYGTTLNVYGFQSGSAFEWRVRSNCPGGEQSGWSDPAPFNTLPNTLCYSPSWTSTVNISSTAATFTWSPVSGAQSYSVEFSVLNGTWTNVPGSPTTSTSITLNGLSPNTTYQWRVRTYCGNGLYSNWTNTQIFSTGSGICNPTATLVTTNITSYSATWDWAVVSGAVNYSIQWRHPGGTWNNLNGGPFYNSVVHVVGLQNCTAYEWRVRTNCGNGSYSDWSSASTFTSLCGSSCDTPANPVTLSVNSTTATVQWDEVSGAVSYLLQFRLNNGTWYYVSGNPFSDNYAIISGLNPNTTYQWRVRTYCGNGQFSAYTSGITFTTTAAATCNAPTGLIASNITQNSATLQWGTVTGAVNYVVEYRTTGGTWYMVAGSPFTGTSANLSGLQPGTNYEWRVRTNCGNNNFSAYSVTSYLTTMGGGGSGNNDNCVDAINLTVGNTCQYTSGSNINSSPSSPVPMGPCFAGGYKDVWFKFNMPGGTNPQVTIRTTAGSLIDAVMEVYNGNDCNNLSLIACEDDNNNGNGSTMPVLNLQGMAGQTIWVRIWGYYGTSGTFSICVFNYWSANYSEPVDLESNSIPDEMGTESIVDPGIIIDSDVTPVMQVAPNPASDVLTVTLLQSDKVIVSALYITDMSGQRLFSKKYDQRDSMEFKDQLDVSGFVPGVYLLQVVTTEGMQTEKVVISR